MQQVANWFKEASKQIACTPIPVNVRYLPNADLATFQ
jgi:hypothetical protein